MADPCGEQHPEIASVTCTKNAPCFDTHLAQHWPNGIEAVTVTWPNPLRQPARKPGKRDVKVMARAGDRPGTAGPPRDAWERTGEQNKEVGSSQVIASTPEDYKRDFSWRFEVLLRTGNLFTSEDITATVGQPPNHPNAVGALFSALVKEAGKTGRITYVKHVKAERSNQNATKIGQYRGNGKT